MTMSYESESEIEAIVRAFESCTTGRDEFNHQGHLVVAAWYLHKSTPEAAFDKMRTGLLRFLDHHKVGRAKYNETLTMFWIKVVQNVFQQVEPDVSFLDLTNTILGRLGNSRLVLQYYSEKLLWSEEARNRWVEPDLRKL